ncbi:MAG: gamma-glutamyltransferase, partial [Flammeovirgaceae bacterium]|nr:gamma-glutamyltransferase [Flammeovirgaceae bacterium]MDW8287535.1 gamma-glutamyltransferase [Flammeovirgaceae bacterium]
KNIVFDFFAQTPRHKRPTDELNFYDVILDFGDTQQVFHGGLASMAVPGNIAGLFHVHRRLGKMPFRELAQPAIELAKKGIVVDDYFKWCIGLVGPIQTSLPTGKQHLEPQGRPLQVGDTFCMSPFANMLEFLAIEGPREFYEGEIAKQIVKDCRVGGGHLTMDDFIHYQVVERKPLTVSYRNWEIATNPPPSAGGTMIAFTLKMLEKFDLKRHGFGSEQHLQYLTHAQRITKAARSATFDQHQYEPDIVDRYFHHLHIDKWHIELLAALNRWGSTTHLSVADQYGNWASVTTSFGAGCGYVVPNTGIMMNNMLGEADLNPKGFHLWQPNQRITSMMSPTFVLKDKKPFFATGTGGANRIRTTIAQVISNLIDFEMSPQEAIEAPRLHWEEGEINIEPGFPEESVAAITTPEPLKKKVFAQKAFYFGGAHSVFCEGDSLNGVGDARRVGAVMKT